MGNARSKLVFPIAQGGLTLAELSIPRAENCWTFICQGNSFCPEIPLSCGNLLRRAWPEESPPDVMREEHKER